MKVAHLTPDLPRILDVVAAQKLWQRKSFRVGGRTFVKIDDDDDTYRCGNITVYRDQQDSSAWAARVGQMRTAYYWAPEFAVKALLDTVEAVTG